MFLFEAILLGMFGSALGALVGYLGGYVAAQLIGLPLTFRVEWFGIAVVVGVFVGIVAGIYPAWDASHSTPSTRSATSETGVGPLGEDVWATLAAQTVHVNCFSGSKNDRDGANCFFAVRSENRSLHNSALPSTEPVPTFPSS
ncbi:ABC transporter permease [Haladaptatus sp. R4]|uniref:ABC transporter permease n=1 Tax=Haladaptatus sp. R4 TaxID=1679489 RepID=UPI001CC0B132|nr:FtsX-like permease family protein [Haladaptatus sp. R4]